MISLEQLGMIWLICVSMSLMISEKTIGSFHCFCKESGRLASCGWNTTPLPQRTSNLSWISKFLVFYVILNPQRKNKGLEAFSVFQHLKKALDGIPLFESRCFFSFGRSWFRNLPVICRGHSLGITICTTRLPLMPTSMVVAWTRCTSLRYLVGSTFFWVTVGRHYINPRQGNRLHRK